MADGPDLALGIDRAKFFRDVRAGARRLAPPLVNRDEDRLIYIWQSAKGLPDCSNASLSMPEIQELSSRVKTAERGRRFLDYRLHHGGLGAPREVQAGVVGGAYFQVMGLRPVLGRLLDTRGRRPERRGRHGADVSFLVDGAEERSRRCLAKPSAWLVRGTRTATVVGVLEPCVPYPADTEIIANVVTSPHHLSATMVTGRIHRMTELFGSWRPARHWNQAARNCVRARHHQAGTSRSLSRQGGLPINAASARPDHVRSAGPFCWC